MNSAAIGHGRAGLGLASKIPMTRVQEAAVCINEPSRYHAYTGIVHLYHDYNLFLTDYKLERT